MQARDVEALVSRYVDRVWNQGDTAALYDLTTPAFRYYLGSQPPRDRAAFAQFLALTREAFPDWRVHIVHVIVDGNGAAIRWEGRVTHQGAFRGIAPTGKTIDVSGINMYSVENGRVSEEREQTDSLGMLQQLGVLPV